MTFEQANQFLVEAYPPEKLYTKIITTTDITESMADGSLKLIEVLYAGFLEGVSYTLENMSVTLDGSEESDAR